MNPETELLDSLLFFTRGAMYMYMRSLPSNAMQAIDSRVLSDAMTALCLNAIAELQNAGVKSLDTMAMTKLQIKMLDAITESLNFLFFGRSAEA